MLWTVCAVSDNPLRAHPISGRRRSCRQDVSGPRAWLAAAEAALNAFAVTFGDRFPTAETY
jgi:hypothetical protein